MYVPFDKETRVYMTRDRAAERVSRIQILGCERGQGKYMFSCSANHEQDW